MARKKVSVVFGNPNVGCWTLELGGPNGRAIEFDGALEVPGFHAQTWMELSPAAVRRFHDALETMDRTVAGSGT